MFVVVTSKLTSLGWVLLMFNQVKVNSYGRVKMRKLIKKLFKFVRYSFFFCFTDVKCGKFKSPNNSTSDKGDAKFTK